MKLTRRKFLALGGAAGVYPWLPAWAAVSRDDLGSVAYPAFVDEEIARTRTRFLAWKGSDDAFVFPIVSDVHSGIPDLGDAVDWSDRKYHLLFVARAAEAFGADFVAELGDTGIDRNADWVAQDLAFAERGMASREALYSVFTKPIVHCIGNHDLTNGVFKMHAADYAGRFNGPLAGVQGIVLSPAQDYGIWDFPSKLTRIVFLNTSDGYGEWSAVSAAQKAFYEAALDVADGWNVMTISHIPLEIRLGRWNYETETDYLRDEAWRLDMTEIVEKAADRPFVNYVCLHGHAHVDAMKSAKGVVHATTQSYGTVWSGYVSAGDRFTPFTPGRELLIDVAAMKPGSGECRLFRIGAGGASADRLLSAKVTSCFVGGAPSGGVGASTRSSAESVALGRSAGRMTTTAELRERTEGVSGATGIDPDLDPGLSVILR